SSDSYFQSSVRAASLCHHFAIGPHMLPCKCEEGCHDRLERHRQTLPDYFLYDARCSDESWFFPRFSEQEPREPPAKLKKKDIVALKKLSDTQIESLICEVQCRSSFWNDKDKNFKNTTLTRKSCGMKWAPIDMSR
ncbi:hypothetical protein J6590_091038, partial [Homalodisca vitripennis]